MFIFLFGEEQKIEAKNIVFIFHFLRENLKKLKLFHFHQSTKKKEENFKSKEKLFFFRR